MGKNWYPIINEDTCIKCGKCIAFCKHGVYDKSKGNTPVVIAPVGCVDHCHGCGDICPTGSITYVGEDTGWIPPNAKADKESACSCGDDCACGDNSQSSENQNKLKGRDSIMQNSKNTTDCGCGTDCGCESTVTTVVQATKNLIIEWRHLDVDGETCERCYDTGENLAAEVKRLNRALNPQGINVKYNEVKLDEAQIHESNVILFNGVPIEDILDIEVSENYCGSCSALVGKDVSCRTIKYDGNQYDDVPAKAIRQAAYEVLGLNNVAPTKSGCCDSGSGCDCGDTQTTAKTMAIYEPSMCCSTGLCGVGVDPELLRISTVLDTLKKHGIEVKRYNLTSFPQEFVKSTVVNERLNDEGVEVLPITVVDGKIIITKRYPKNADFIKFLGIPASYLGEEEKPAASESCGCGCAGGCC